MDNTEKLSAALIKSALAEEYKNISITVFDTLDSTNLEAKRRNAEPCPFIVLSDTQTAGRGRLGRSFYSPAKTGLYMSISQAADDLPENPVTLTCAAAAAVSMAIERLTKVPTEIKWVNDVYIGGKKVCGILAEGIFDPETGKLCRTVTGIGVNISTKSFPEGIEAESLNTDISRNILAAAIADNFFEISAGRKDWLAYYRSRSFIKGKRIKYIINGKTHYGTAGDIDDSGALFVTDDSGETISLFTGEVTVRISAE